MHLWGKTGSTNWHDYDGWEDSTSDTLCDAYGITCEFGEDTTSSSNSNSSSAVLEMGRVVYIDLSSNGLSGLIPSEIFMLPYLRELNVKDNDVEFQFNGIQNAKQLTHLMVSNTTIYSLNGINNATGLIEFHASDAELAGSAMLDMIFQLINLKTLYLSYNTFASTLPSTIKNLKYLEYFDCYECGLIGTIPASDLIQLSNLKELSLGENSFSGNFPSTLYQLPLLQLLIINDNPIE